MRFALVRRQEADRFWCRWIGHNWQTVSLSVPPGSEFPPAPGYGYGWQTDECQRCGFRKTGTARVAM